MSDVLAHALWSRQRAYRDIIERHRDVLDQVEVEALREAVELVGCLRRLAGPASVPVIHEAFGAPGDFGYESEIGMALDGTYRGAK